MTSLLRHLWQTRDRPSIGTLTWWKAWGRRIQQFPSLSKQIWCCARLEIRGAQVATKVFFSDISLISGPLDQLTVGEQSFVGRAELAVHAPLTIGRSVCINDGVKLLTATHDIRDPLWPTIARAIVIEDYAWIATNAIILPGVRIGQGAVVAAGAVVSRDVPPNAVAYGNPSRIKENQRAERLEYSPVAHLALFTAWRRITPAHKNPTP